MLSFHQQGARHAKRHLRRTDWVLDVAASLFCGNGE